MAFRRAERSTRLEKITHGQALTDEHCACFSNNFLTMAYQLSVQSLDMISHFEVICHEYNFYIISKLQYFVLQHKLAVHDYVP